MNKVDISAYKIDKVVSLKNMATLSDLGADQKELKKKLENVREELGDFQDTMYAHGKYSVTYLPSRYGYFRERQPYS